MTHHHEREVVERSSGAGAVAVVAIVILVILGLLAVMAFGGLNWLRGGGADTDEGDIDVEVNPPAGGVLPTAAPPDAGGGGPTPAP